ncbi:MAG: alpha-N-arabinofuranosidase, partial [Dehalococcoidia bacterium]|nr:alpha-N-arabinofuranosidase [Dehalococcoidia bacterium]
MEARVTLSTSFNNGQIDSRIFSGFLEHLGRSIYGGVYEPESPNSNDEGIRADVAEDMTGMNMP